jgi:hypothetical protein
MLPSRSVPAAARRAAGRLLVPLAAAAPLAAQGVPQDAPGGTVARADGSRAGACESRDERGWGDDDRGRACERRTLALSPRAALRIDAGSNGGAAVGGADSVRAPAVVAVVTAGARTDAEAARIAALVELVDDGGTLRARGPEQRGDGGDRGYRDRTWWAVSWRVVVPRRTDVEVRTNNGGARVARVTGRLRLETNNGGVTLDSVGGAVRAHSNNGGVRATLAGRGWEGGGLADAGLDLHSNNGGAVLRVPADYAARVSVGTNNGSLAVEFPVTVQGRVDPRRIELTLGGGGAPIRVTTNNGGARLGRVE